MIISVKDLITNVTEDKCSLMFKCSYKAKAMLEKLKRGDYELTIVKAKKGRSLAQNRLLWELLGQISVKENGNTADDVNIYCQLIEQSGAKCEYMLVPAADDVLDRLRRVYRAVRVIESRWYKGKPMWMVKCFYGSSKMDTKEMSILIDKTIERAEADGIDADPWRERFDDTGRSNH